VSSRDETFAYINFVDSVNCVLNPEMYVYSWASELSKSEMGR